MQVRKYLYVLENSLERKKKKKKQEGCLEKALNLNLIMNIKIWMHELECGYIRMYKELILY